MSSHYKEIGCVPIIKDNESCPTSFNCDHLKDVDFSTCNYRGKVYSDFQGPDRDQLPACVPYAMCTNGTFFAGHYDCGYLFESTEERCVDVRDGCCPKKFCGEAEIAKLTVCYADGKAYYGGEKWTPKEDKCIECKCDESFDNSTSIYKNKNCKPEDCFQDFWNLKRFAENCAAVYYGDDRCCSTQAKCRKYI